MGSEPSDTQAVVQAHLDAFVRQMGVDAIVRDYHEDERFMSDAATYHDRREIRHLFEAFLPSLPPNAIDRFSPRPPRFRSKD